MTEHTQRTIYKPFSLARELKVSLERLVQKDENEHLEVKSRGAFNAKPNNLGIYSQ